VGQNIVTRDVIIVNATTEKPHAAEEIDHRGGAEVARRH
jgi:hypothetical protein